MDIATAITSGKEVTIEKLSFDPDEPQVIRLNDLADKWESDAWKRHNARQSDTLFGPITGLAPLDAQLGGALLPGIHILIGNTGAGKTAFALQIAATCGFPAVYVTCEMQPLELLRRVTARVTGKYLGRFKTGELDQQEAKKLLDQALAATQGLVILDASRGFADSGFILNAAEAATGSSGHLLVVIDSLHSWVDSAPCDLPEYERLNKGLAALSKMAAYLNCPVLCVAERNRASASSGGLNSGAGTRKIEYCAETVMDMERDSETQPDGNGNVPVVIKLQKNRNGAAGKEVNLLFHGARQSFEPE